MTIETLGRPTNRRACAQQDTVLSPRFYTTDFDETRSHERRQPCAREWDALIAEMRADPNKGHFLRNDDSK